jgi:hypothetical protein
MSVFLAVMLVALLPDLPFVADASAERTYTVNISREDLRLVVDDIGLFARNMPGVVGVTPLENNRYAYLTEKHLPLAGTMRTEFLIEKTVVGDSVTWYRSIRPDDPNYMSCKVVLRAVDEKSTSIRIVLRIRLAREDASEVHWMAPLLGEQFISDRMTGDLEEMLSVFIERSSDELYARQRTLGSVR